MALDISRRGLITGLIAFTAAPAIVRAESLMPVKVLDEVLNLAPQWTVHGSLNTVYCHMSDGTLWVSHRGGPMEPV
jgi:hypothetical protein